MIENHSKQQERRRQDDPTELEQREEDTPDEVVEDEEEDEEEEEEEAAGDGTSPEVSFTSQSNPFPDGRLVKSHSEAPIGSPKGQRTTVCFILLPLV